MQFSVSSNAKSIARRVGKQGKELSDSVKRALSRTAQSGINIIEDRTSKGYGYKGGKFDGYNSVYASFRDSRGRGRVPNLQFTGSMLGSITSKSNSKQAEIFFSRATEAKKAAMNNKTRPFFGFNRKEEKRLGDIFFRALK